MKRKNQFSTSNKYWLLILAIICIVLMGLSGFAESGKGPLSWTAGYTIVPMQKGINRVGMCCIGYAFRPDLSSRLTWSGRTFLQKPEAFGHYDSHIILATHSGILSRMKSTAAFATTSLRTERSPTIPHGIPSFGILFSPVKFSAQGHSTSELLRTL